MIAAILEYNSHDEKLDDLLLEHGNGRSDQDY